MNDDAGVIVRHMRELKSANHISGGENSFVRRAQARVDLDALGGVRTPAASKPRFSIFGLRPAARSRCEPSRRSSPASVSITSATP